MKQVISIIILILTFICQQAYSAESSVKNVFDIDGNGEITSLTDGMLVIRYLFDFKAETLIGGVIGERATRVTASEIETYIKDHLSELDIDDNGKAEPLTDGILLLRYLSGFRDSVLVNGVVGANAKRLTAGEIEEYIQKKIIPTDKSWNVPFLYQGQYRYIDLAAGAATSLAMILQYYYPDSQIDPRVIYHSGIQNYIYNFGPANAYRNVRSGTLTNKLITDHVPGSAINYYLNFSSGATNDSISDYLNFSWGVDTSIFTLEENIYKYIKEGPILIHVEGDKSSGVYADNKYVVLIGVDDNNTSTKTDDYFIVNDPEERNGAGKRIPYGRFFSGWFIDGVKFKFSDTPLQRKHTVLVDTGHNPVSGVATIHKFELDNPSAWRFGYSDGDWYYHTLQSTYLSATWKPKLKQAGRYRITTNPMGVLGGSTITYILYDERGHVLSQGVAQHRSRDGNHIKSIIFPDVNIQDGVYVKAVGIPSYSYIDALKFQYLGD